MFNIFDIGSVCVTRETICFTPPSDSLRDKERRGCNSGIVYSGLEGAKGITISQLGHSKDGAMWGGTRDTGASPEGHFEGRIGTLGDRIKGHRCSTIWRHRGPINSCGARSSPNLVYFGDHTDWDQQMPCVPEQLPPPGARGR